MQDYCVLLNPEPFTTDCAAMDVAGASSSQNGSVSPDSPKETNGETNGLIKTPETKPKRSSRSRSKTPQKRRREKKLSTELNGKEKSKDAKEEEEAKLEPSQSPSQESHKKSDSGSKKKSKERSVTPKEKKEKVISPKNKPSPSKAIVEGEGMEMDALVINPDEPDPELQFDENSDLDSGKGSPVLTRCVTRRSQTRNIPTPKTPKGEESGSSTPIPDIPELEEKEELNGSDTNCSTLANAGGDATRLDFSDSIFESSTFLNASKNKSLVESVRSLSPRRSIRPLNDDYRKRALKNNHSGRSGLNASIPDPIERVARMKRKSRSETPEDRKRMKIEGGFLSLLTSPITKLKERFQGEVATSTPKLTGYKDANGVDCGDEIAYAEGKVSEEEKKSWCSIM